MKNIILSLFAFFLINISGNAQNKRHSKEKIRAYKIAFLTDRLDLTPEEAERFWALYNLYDKRMMELRHQEHRQVFRNIKKKKGVNALSESESKELLHKIHSLENERHNIKKEFFDKIKTVLTFKKQLKLEVAEHDFRKKLIRKLRKKNKN